MTTTVPSESTKASLATAVWEYHGQLAGSTEALAYLESRKITSEAAKAFQLGYVGTPRPEDGKFEGRLAIPYLTSTGPVMIRFRDITGDTEKKYLTRYGDISRPFNPGALQGSTQPVYITEGEIDAISMWVAGLHAVAFPGAGTWKSLYARMFRMRTAVIVADGDSPGQKFAERVASDLEDHRIIYCPAGEDPNSILIATGPGGLRKLVGA